MPQVNLNQNNTSTSIPIIHAGWRKGSSDVCDTRQKPCWSLHQKRANNLVTSSKKVSFQTHFICRMWCSIVIHKIIFFWKCLVSWNINLFMLLKFNVYVRYHFNTIWLSPWIHYFTTYNLIPKYQTTSALLTPQPMSVASVWTHPAFAPFIWPINGSTVFAGEKNTLKNLFCLFHLIYFMDFF